MERCACCGFETECLAKYNNRPELLCELCAGTKTWSYNNSGYEAKTDTIILMKTMCHLANAIIQSNNEIEKHLLDIEQKLINIKEYIKLL